MMTSIQDLNHAREKLTTSRALTYSYIHISPSAGSDYVLLLHGFPSLAIDWHNQITYLTERGYGIIAPDLLGYGETDRPTTTDSYRFKLMAQDLVEILDHHRIRDPIPGIGHDWGVAMLASLEFYHPERVSQLAFLTIGFAGFGDPFDLDAVNAMTKKALGYEAYGYIDFLARDAQAVDTLNAHHDALTDLFFAQDHELWKENMGALGGMKQWLETDRRTERIRGFSESLAEAHQSASLVHAGYLGGVQWYRAHADNLNVPDARDRVHELGVEHYSLSPTKPLLLILAVEDCIAVADVQEQMTQSYGRHMQVAQLRTGHWTLLEEPHTSSEMLASFLASS